ncbi:hypothetical protein V8E36_004852 [Tilletia maclaganii]
MPSHASSPLRRRCRAPTTGCSSKASPTSTTADDSTPSSPVNDAREGASSVADKSRQQQQPTPNMTHASYQSASGLSTVSPHLAGMHMYGIYPPTSMAGQRSTQNPANRVVASLRPAHLAATWCFASSIQRPFLSSFFVQTRFSVPHSSSEEVSAQAVATVAASGIETADPQTLQHPSFIGHIKTSVDAILLLSACDHSSHHHPCDASSPAPRQCEL